MSIVPDDCLVSSSLVLKCCSFNVPILLTVDLPTKPLETEGPTLQHLGKTRPKPARNQRNRPRGTIKPSPITNETPTANGEEEPPKVSLCQFCFTVL